MLLTQLDARASVLKQVAAVAVWRQAEFLEDRPAGRVQLTWSGVARDLGVHPSTVARAVCGRSFARPAVSSSTLRTCSASGSQSRPRLRGCCGVGVQRCPAARRASRLPGCPAHRGQASRAIGVSPPTEADFAVAGCPGCVCERNFAGVGRNVLVTGWHGFCNYLIRRVQVGPI
jgi:Sigma-54, DNA binding domain